MKKLPTLFEKLYDDNGNVTGITENVTEGMEWVLKGKGVATVKWDGACCAVIDGKFYKRYDAKHGKTPPADAIPCCDPDPITGHWPHWVPIKEDNPADKWFLEAMKGYYSEIVLRKLEFNDGTYEAIGPHFQGNPYKIQSDTLVPHGNDPIFVKRTFEGIRDYLSKNGIEGIVFWKDDEPQCKIRRKDFGLEWPIRKC